VESREGLGTRFSVLLPVPETARLLSPNAGSDPVSSREVA